MSNACKDCKWWQPLESTSFEKGDCRGVYPSDDPAIWPVVRRDDWCRHWEKRDDEFMRPANHILADRRPGAAVVELEDNGIVRVTHHNGDQFELSALEGLTEKDRTVLYRMAWGEG